VDQSVLDRSLEELDGQSWPEPDSSATNLIRDVHRLRLIPIGTLSNGDLRQLLGQRMGIEWLVPLALERLLDAPLAGDWYPGDVLNAVLGVGDAYWNEHRTETVALYGLRKALEQVRSDATEFLERDDWPAFG
jgi:hypothetical protein